MASTTCLQSEQMNIWSQLQPTQRKFTQLPLTAAAESMNSFIRTSNMYKQDASVIRQPHRWALNFHTEACYEDPILDSFEVSGHLRYTHRYIHLYPRTQARECACMHAPSYRGDSDVLSGHHQQDPDCAIINAIISLLTYYRGLVCSSLKMMGDQRPANWRHDFVKIIVASISRQK